MRNIKLLLEYDGTNYVGWQRQQNGRSIQGEIEIVLKQILQESVNVIGAGRTDAGVHARGQAANFRTETKLDLLEIKGGLNGLLPEDIVAHEIEEAGLEFHSRYSAKEREYSYRIALTPSALLRNFSWHVKYSLSIELMQHAANVLIGTHDFGSFCKANSDVDNHSCIVSVASWEINETFLRFVIRANRFLHGMVRALVGTIVDLGRGYISFDEYLKIFEMKNRSEAGMSVPAKGLILEKVFY
ncbi:MAG: tRNA pseudouridine(38-40) synthase TruA [Bacteroidota bacterium]|nr:tRNA pseudouridine(38-40) synthase TruA [Bacteroidota bacterium]